MPVPKRKRSRARRDSRHANKGMKAKTITACKQCQAPISPHQACSTCGFYKGNKVLQTKIDRTIKRVQTRQTKKAAQAATTTETTEE